MKTPLGSVVKQAISKTVRIPLERMDGPIRLRANNAIFQQTTFSQRNRMIRQMRAILHMGMPPDGGTP